MHDPIPRFIQEHVANMRCLLGSGWYIMGYDGTQIVGPCDNPEACVLALKELNEAATSTATTHKRSGL
jgi:hypothetical protein